MTDATDRTIPSIQGCGIGARPRTVFMPQREGFTPETRLISRQSASHPNGRSKPGQCREI